MDINNNSLCGVQFILNGMLYLMLNAYMTCGRCIEYPEYVDVMNMMQQLIQSLNPTFIIYGDFNTDTSRATPHMYGLLQCIQDCAFTLCIDLHIADVPYTYINNYTGIKSRIDHFLVSDVLSECVSECCIIDNHLYSDNVPPTITFDIEVDHAKTTEWTFRKKKRQHGS